MEIRIIPPYSRVFARINWFFFNQTYSRVFDTLKSYGISNKEIISATQNFSSKVLVGTIKLLVQEDEKK